MLYKRTWEKSSTDDTCPYCDKTLWVLVQKDGENDYVLAEACLEKDCGQWYYSSVDMTPEEAGLK